MLRLLALLRRTAARGAVLLSLIATGALPARVEAQRRVQLEVAPPGPASTLPMVSASNLFADRDMRDLVRSGFPASLKYRLELWRVGGLFNDVESRQEWEIVIQFDPTAERYRVLRRQSGQIEDLGSFATLSTAQGAIERPARVTLPPARAGRRYYYTLTLAIEALSVSDMDQLERWLRGVRGTTAASAVGSGVRTLMLRMLGGESQRYEQRSVTFTAG